MRRLVRLILALGLATPAFAQAPAASPSPSINRQVDVTASAWVEKDTLSTTGAQSATNPGARLELRAPLYLRSTLIGRATATFDVYGSATCQASCSVDFSSLDTFGSAARALFGYEWQIGGSPDDSVRTYLRGEAGFAGGFASQSAGQSWHRFGVGPLLEFNLPGNKHPVQLSVVYGKDDEVQPPASLTLPRQLTINAWIPAVPLFGDSADLGLAVESIQNIFVPAGTTIPSVTRYKVLFAYSGKLGGH